MRTRAQERKCGRCSDDFYRALSDWTTNRFDNRSNAKCRQLGAAYQRELDKLIDTLEASRPTPEIRSKVKNASDYKDILKKSLRVLEYMPRH